MGTYYRYVNHTRKEFVSLNGLRNGGDKLHAAILCGGALAYLMFDCPSADPNAYRGRWGATTVRTAGCFDAVRTRHNAQAIAIVSDTVLDFWEMEQLGSADYEGYVDITTPLRQELERVDLWDFIDRRDP